ncbi:MAG: radical SAM protein [Gammaproteobacteria bacterium]|nr:radical SAM protein [Gammaproteobacteria bacterium]
MNETPPGSIGCGIVGYTIGNNRYLNVTNRCTLRCRFRPTLNGCWTTHGDTLRLQREPTVDEIVVAAGDAERYEQIVFCGFGEPTLRLYDVLEASRQLRRHGAVIRIDTDGLANLVHERDITPDLEGIVDALSVSLNAHNAEVYARHCRPIHPHSYEAMLDFVARAREFVPDITLTAIDGLPEVDIAACRDIAYRLGLRFRRRVLDGVG